MSNYLDPDWWLSINAPYFASLPPDHVRQLVESQLEKNTVVNNWRDLVVELYRQGKITDDGRGRKLVRILHSVTNYEWLPVIEHARLYDDEVAIAIEQDEVIMALIDDFREKYRSANPEPSCYAFAAPPPSALQ